MTSVTLEKMQAIIEAAIMVAGHPLSIEKMLQLFPEDDMPSTTDISNALEGIAARHQDGGIELQQTASGYRFQAKSEFSPWLSRLWEERAPRYSRAFLETLSIIAYKQPITRAEIEEIRGVTVSSHIVKTLLEREWIRVIGHREIPGRPAILGTTKEFLDYFNLKSLAELPTLAELKNFEAQEAQLQVQLALDESQIGPADSEMIPEEREAIEADAAVGVEASLDDQVAIDTETTIEATEAESVIEIEAEVELTINEVEESLEITSNVIDIIESSEESIEEENELAKASS